jgi:hypothetical protein
MTIGSLFGQDFAPIALSPDNPNNDPDITLGINFIKNVKVPDKSEVGVSAYPGSQIIQTNPGYEETLPSVRLVASDNVEAVLEYYKKELNEWNYSEFYGVHMFWKGEDKMNAMMGEEPVVQIENAEKFNKIAPEAKTTILIGYSANK